MLIFIFIINKIIEIHNDRKILSLKNYNNNI